MARFTGAQFGTVDFRRSRLDHAVFDRAIFHVTGQVARIGEQPPPPLLTRLDYACVTDAHFTRSDLGGLTFENAVGLAVHLDGSVLDGSALAGSELQRTPLDVARVGGDRPSEWRGDGIRKDLTSRLDYFCNARGEPAP